MNYIKYTLIAFILLLFSTACSNFLEPDLTGTLTIDSDALKSEEGLEAALVGAYHPLTRTWQTGFAHTIVALMMGGDDMTTHKAANKQEFRDFDQYNVPSNNSRLGQLWAGIYKSIQGTNNIIANYQDASGDPNGINHIAGEAFFLRAYNYFWIVRLWGETPLVLNSHVFSDDLLAVGKSSVSDIYTQIVLDLQMAETLMSNAKRAPGRANRGTAKAILAEVYLHMAGWPMNETSNYALAASKAKEVIDEAGVFGFGLLNNFEDLWNAENNGNVEEVFALNYSALNNNNGNPSIGSSARPGEEGGWDDYFAEITFFENFPAGPRKEATFYTELGDGTPWQNFRTERPYYQKMFGPENNFINAVSMVLERMSEVYLIYAEAQVMATGNNADPDALEAINKIIRRANGLNPNTPDAGVDLTSVTQERIIQEKAWEFAAEYTRWFDIQRLQMAEDVINNKNVDELQPQSTSINYLFPLPVSETSVNPNLGG